MYTRIVNKNRTLMNKICIFLFDILTYFLSLLHIIILFHIIHISLLHHSDINMLRVLVVIYGSSPNYDRLSMNANLNGYIHRLYSQLRKN